METDQKLFAAEVTAIAEALNIEPIPSTVLDLAKAVSDSVQSARMAQAGRAAKVTSLESVRERQRALAETQEIHTKRKLEMTTLFGVNSLAEVGVKLQIVAKKVELEEQANTTACELLDALRVRTIGEAECALDAADRSALETELAEQKARFEDHDLRSRELFSAHSKAVDQIEAVGGDDAVARIEEQRRTVLLDIEDKALRYLRLRVGIAAAEHALRVYRDRHRGSMITKAAEAFRTISRGTYTGLTTQPDKDNEILVAIGADGSSKIASELSKGTRFQLYLALRIAGHHEYAKVRRLVPFVADDIMETFDNFRAEEALKLFANMATEGQVIYLTHHTHLRDIAQKVCPSAKLHELPDISAGH